MFRRTTQGVVERFQRFVTGQYAAGSTGLQELFLLGDAFGHWADLLTPETTVFAPRAFDQPLPAGTCVVRYEGALDPEGEELQLDGRFGLTAVGYTAAGFVPVSGPTLVRITCNEDFADYLDDADAAQMGTGFRPYLLHPLALLGDRCALGSLPFCPSAAGLRAVAGPGAQSAPTLFATPSSGQEPCLHGIVDDHLVAAARVQRPWLSRYLTVLDVLQRLPERVRVTAQVGGFGYRVLDDQQAPVEALTAPVVLHDDAGYTLVDPVSGRVLRAPRDAAAVVELLSVHPGPDAVDVVGARLGVTAGQAYEAIEKIRGQLPMLVQPVGAGA